MLHFTVSVGEIISRQRALISEPARGVFLVERRFTLKRKGFSDGCRERRGQVRTTKTHPLERWRFWEVRGDRRRRGVEIKSFPVSDWLAQWRALRHIWRKPECFCTAGESTLVSRPLAELLSAISMQKKGVEYVPDNSSHLYHPTPTNMKLSALFFPLFHAGCSSSNISLVLRLLKSFFRSLLV